MKNDGVSSLEFEQVAERFLASEVGKMLREYYATLPDKVDEDGDCDYCDY